MRQSLFEHCRSVDFLAGRFLHQMGLAYTARLTALLHDLGKATRAFNDYLIHAVGHPDEKASGPPHAPAGAIFAYERWFSGNGWRRLTAQLVSMIVYAHHAGLPDCLNDEGISSYLLALSQEKKEEIHYAEAVGNYLAEVADEGELDDLFERACGEVRSFFGNQSAQAAPFRVGLFARLLLSALIDADRWDSACFERGEKPEPPSEAPPSWRGLLEKLDTTLNTNFRNDSPISKIRTRISDACADGAARPRGVFTLTVPTGGGKTLSSLRFALAHAAHHTDIRRVFYVIPFNTILDQNAADIRKALDGYDILEHHSGVIQETEEESSAYRNLTQRWDADIILTSMVQFLNALFRAENTNARRMHALCHSILVFDEIQALPKRCTKLFEEAVRFLVEQCGCTVLLCTATQPRLDLGGTELIGDVSDLFRNLRRAAYVDESHISRANAQAALDLVALFKARGSALAVVNTKAVAQDLFERVRALADSDVLCAHLSTLMCPAHRMDALDEVKARLARRLPTFCVSTALIEAGINVSFPAVVRSLAGLPSIIQAGGRCNRNCEEALGTVYVWRLSEEKLSRLKDIRKGQEISDAILRHCHEYPGDIGDPEIIARYFEKERLEYEGELAFPYEDKTWKSNLFDMLSENRKCVIAARDKKDEPLKRLAMPQSFRTANKAFQVIDQATRGILAPYKDGDRIILSLAGAHAMKDEIQLIRQAQRYSVNVFEHTFQELMARGALIPVGETGAFALRKEFYSLETGVRLEPGELELLNY
jgi:CRISPR-associated endonuclease/helicase Cas3